EAEGLAIAFGMRHAEVPRDVLARVPALLVAEDNHGLVLEAGEPAHDRFVVSVDAIAVELDEILEEETEEVEGVRALRVTGELRALPGRQRAIDPLLRPPETLLETVDLVARALRILGRAKLRDAVLELQERPLELKLVRHTRRVYFRGRGSPRLSPAAPRRRARTIPWRGPRLPARPTARGRRAAWDPDAPRR